jgi:hypothetical protein
MPEIKFSASLKDTVFMISVLKVSAINPMKSYLNAYSVDSEIRFKSPNNMAMRIETHKKSYKINQ